MEPATIFLHFGDDKSLLECFRDIFDQFVHRPIASHADGSAETATFCKRCERQTETLVK